MSKPRDYAAEYRNYHGKPEQIKRRAARNKARKLTIKERGKAAVQGKDVDHIDKNPLNNARSNRRTLSIKRNRGRK